MVFLTNRCYPVFIFVVMRVRHKKRFISFYFDWCKLDDVRLYPGFLDCIKCHIMDNKIIKKSVSLLHKHFFIHRIFISIVVFKFFVLYQYIFDYSVLAYCWNRGFPRTSSVSWIMFIRSTMGSCMSLGKDMWAQVDLVNSCSKL